MHRNLISRAPGLLAVTCLLLTGAVAWAQTNQEPETLVINDPQTVSQDRISYSWQGFPQTAQSPDQAAVVISKDVPAEVHPDQEYSYDIVVTNRARYQIDEVVIVERLPENFNFVAASPSPQVRGRELRWEFALLAPGQREVITVTGTGSEPGAIRHTGSTDLGFSLPMLTSIISVVEPALEAIARSPESAVLFDPVTVNLTFRNSGSAPVRNARLAETLPEGLVTTDGKRNIEINAGDLMPGESKIFTLNLQGTEMGNYNVPLQVKADEGITAEANLRLAILRPDVTLVAEAPSKRFIGNIVTYRINVENRGNGVAQDVAVRQSLPPGTTFLSANEAGVVDQGYVIWEDENLAPGESKTLESRFRAEEIMVTRSTVSLEAKAAPPRSQTLVTELAGIPALLTELVDINDPVPVGETETYIITVDNQGSLAARNVVLYCDLEDSMELVSAGGATEGKLDGRTLTFTALPSLGVGAQAEWRVIVRALRPGDVRFTARIESEQLTRPVRRAESTRFYR